MVPRGDRRGLSGIADRRGGAPGKLREAARAWAFARTGRLDPTRSIAIDDDLRAQCAALGISVSDGPVASDVSDVEVWPENWPTVLAFIAAATQWLAVAGFGGIVWVGLRYADLEAVLVRHPGAVFEDLQEMEAEALPILNQSD